MPLTSVFIKENEIYITNNDVFYFILQAIPLCKAERAKRNNDLTLSNEDAD